jgi:HEPN domain-containing protein
LRDKALEWIYVAEENYKSANLLLQSELLNPCLQNKDQAVDRYCKAVLVKRGLKPERTHLISSLSYPLSEMDVDLGLSEEEC